MQLTSGSVQSAMAVVTLEMLSFLVRDENLQVIEVTFTVVAPWAIEKLLERGTASFFTHCGVDVNRDKIDSDDVNRDKGDFKNRKICVRLQRRDEGRYVSQIRKLAMMDEALYHVAARDQEV